MTPQYFPTSLMDMPDELLVQIVENLHVIRSDQSQCHAFKHLPAVSASRTKEVSRQNENHQRQKTLHALCLTSQRLKNICEPVLYSAFLGSATWHGFGPVNSFYHTITKHPQLAQCVQYVENRLNDHLGNTMYRAMESCGAVEIVQDYFFKLASIVSHTCNIQHLSVVSPETKDVKFWGHLIHKKSSTQIASHFTKLQSLCVQVDSGNSSRDEASAWFQKLINALTNVPTLRSLRATGVVSATLSPLVGKFESLDVLEIFECMLDFDVVVQLLSACKMLKHFSCHWAHFVCLPAPASDIYHGLLAHKDRLESLHVDFRKVCFYYKTSTVESWGSLRCFSHLKYVTIYGSAGAKALSELYYAGPKPPMRIAQILPPSLECLTVLIESYSEQEDFDIHCATALYALQQDCKILLPKFHRLELRMHFSIRNLIFEPFLDDLMDKFDEAEIYVTLKDEVWCLFCDIKAPLTFLQGLRRLLREIGRQNFRILHTCAAPISEDLFEAQICFDHEDLS